MSYNPGGAQSLPHRKGAGRRHIFKNNSAFFPPCGILILERRVKAVWFKFSSSRKDAWWCMASLACRILQFLREISVKATDLQISFGFSWIGKWRLIVIKSLGCSLEHSIISKFPTDPHFWPYKFWHQVFITGKQEKFTLQVLLNSFLPTAILYTWTS